MKYSAKHFLDFLNEAHFDVSGIWQMKSDVSYFITEMIKTFGGEKVGTTGLGPNEILYIYRINEIKFGVMFSKQKHRAEAYIFADPSQIDKLYNEYWEIETELEDTKRVFTLRRRDIRRDIKTEFANGQNLIDSAKRALSLNDVVARSVQFGWKATQKLGKVSSKEEVLAKTPEWEELMQWGVKFSSTLEMLRTGTIAFNVPLWAVEGRNKQDIRKLYSDKKLDHVGRFVIGRLDCVIRFWDFYTNSSKRIEWTPGDNLTTFSDYKQAFARLSRIMEKDSNDSFNQYHVRGQRKGQPLFNNFKFKDGWDENSLENNKMDIGMQNAIDALW